jgi:Tfp pilus assembly protein PilF
MMRLLCCATAMAAVSACTVSGPAARSDAREQTLNVMLERAQMARLAGALSQAESTLETALRIAPGDARLWLELAETQFAAGEFEAARTIAERAMSLSGGNVRIIESAQRIRALTAESVTR